MGRATALLLLLLIALLACATTEMRGEQSPGAYLYAVRLPKSGGGEVDFSSFRGRVLMVDFFTTWLNPSLVAIPGYAALHQRYQGRGLSVVGISMDELGDKVVKPYADALGIPYPVAIADYGIREGHSTFGELTGLPILMIFDRDGRLSKVFLGLVPAEAVEEVIKGLL